MAGQLTITKLLSAVKKGELDVIERSLTTYGLPRSGSKTTDYLILQTALERNQREIAKVLINAGCRVKAIPTDSGCTPLALTFIKEDEEIALMILKRGTTVYIDNTMKSTVLHFTARNKSLKMLRFIFTVTSIDVNLLDIDGKTSLQVLLENCTTQQSNNQINDVLDMIKLLLTKGVSVDFRSSNGKTALHYVATLRQKDITMFVLERIVNVNLCDDQGRTALYYLLNGDYKSENSIYEIVELFIAKGAKIDITDCLNTTVAHIAASKKYFKILNKFIQCQCNVGFQDGKGNTVLHRLLENSVCLSVKEDVINFVNLILSIAPLENIQNYLGKTPLHLAAENHHYKIVEKMLSNFKNVNVTDSDKETLLHIMLKNFCDTHIDIIKRLLNAGGNVDMKNRQGITPVHLAFQTGNKSLMLLVLQHSKILNQYYFHQKSVLHYMSDVQVVSESEKLEVAKIAKKCLEQGIQIDVLDKSLRTPLLAAVLNQNKFMIEFLFKHGANPNYSTSNGTIIEHLIGKPSLSNVDLEIAEMLVHKGANSFSTLKGLVSLFKLNNSHEKRLLVNKLLHKCTSLNQFDASGNTILHLFLDSDVNTVNVDEMKMMKMIEMFLKKGVSINTKNKDGITALHLAAKKKYGLISAFLLKNGANITMVDNKENSVLHFVSMLNLQINNKIEEAIIDLFVKKGCNINAKNIFNKTPLLTAVHCGSINAVKALINHGADMKCTGGENLSLPLHIATECNNTSIMEHLLECGASVYEKRKDGKTALHVVAVYGKLEALKILLEKWTDPDARDNNDRTALHWACWYGKLEIVKELLIWGADVNAVDKLNVTPLMLAQDPNNVVWNELQRYVTLLKTAGINVASQNIHCINNYKKRIDTTALIASAQLEVLKMQKTCINSIITLADVLKMKREKLVVFVNNNNFHEFLASDNFQSMFPLYSPIFESLCTRARIRNYHLTNASNVLRGIVGLALPDDCTKEIFNYVKNEDLINLTRAAPSPRKKIIKRKSNGVLECTPSKKVQLN